MAVTKTTSNLPPTHGQVVVPNDNADLPGGPCQWLWVPAAGNIALIPAAAGQSAVTLTSVPVGQLRLAARRIMATGTTIANLVALW